MTASKRVEVQRTEESLTAHGGLLLTKELMDAIELKKWVEKYLPQPE